MGEPSYFRSDEDGDPILVGERGGDNARVIVTGRIGEHNHFPTWSIDGKWIYYVHYADEAISADLWRVPSIGGAPERLTEEYRDIRSPTPVDSRTVLYVARDEHGSGPWLWAIDVETKVRTRVSVGAERYLSSSRQLRCPSARGHGREIDRYLVDRPYFRRYSGRARGEAVRARHSPARGLRDSTARRCSISLQAVQVTGYGARKARRPLRSGKHPTACSAIPWRSLRMAGWR